MSIGIEPASASKTLQITNIIRAKNSPGRISMPVNRQQYLYARFKHIWGFPEARQGEGYSLSKLRILDTLIDRLHRLKGQSAAVFETPSASPIQNLSPGEIDSMIQNYQQEIHGLAQANGTPYKGAFVDTGLLFNILA